MGVYGFCKLWERKQDRAILSPPTCAVDSRGTPSSDDWPSRTTAASRASWWCTTLHGATPSQRCRSGSTTRGGTLGTTWRLWWWATSGTGMTSACRGRATRYLFKSQNPGIAARLQSVCHTCTQHTPSMYSRLAFKSHRAWRADGVSMHWGIRLGVVHACGWVWVCGRGATSTGGQLGFPRARSWQPATAPHSWRSVHGQQKTWSRWVHA